MLTTAVHEKLSFGETLADYFLYLCFCISDSVKFLPSPNCFATEMV